MEVLENEGREKYSKLYNHAKEVINELHMENERMNQSIIKLKNENISLRTNCNEKQKELNYEIIKENNKYEKKIERMNKMIEELKSRIQVLYIELANKEKNNIQNNEN